MLGERFSGLRDPAGELSRGSFTRFGGRLIVSHDRLEYIEKKSRLTITASQLRSVFRDDKWVVLDYDHNGDLLSVARCIPGRVAACSKGP